MGQELSVAVVATDQIVPHPQNPKIHKRDQIAVIARSLKQYGQRKPIVVAADGKTILAGHGTFLAAKSLGWDRVVIAYSDLEGKEALAYMVADNQSGDGGFYRPLLADVFRAIDDVKLETGFSPDRIDGILKPPPKRQKGMKGGSYHIDIVFRSAEDVDIFQGFLNMLRGIYPDSLTIGDRVIRFLKTHGYDRGNDNGKG